MSFEPATITITIKYTPYGGDSYDGSIFERARGAATKVAAELITNHRITQIHNIEVTHKRTHQ